MNPGLSRDSARARSPGAQGFTFSKASVKGVVFTRSSGIRKRSVPMPTWGSHGSTDDNAGTGPSRIRCWHEPRQMLGASQEVAGEK